MSTVAGLPQYVVLRSKTNGNYLQYQWNDEFTDFYKFMGTKRAVDEVSPFVKLEVVPSTTNKSFVHLRSSYIDKYIQIVYQDGVAFLKATAEAPEEDQSKPTCTLFEPVFTSGQPNTVTLRYVPHQKNIYIFYNSEYITQNYVACVYSDVHTTHFEFAAWESYEDKMKAKDDAKDEQIKAKDEEIKVKNEEIQKLKESYEDKMKAKDDVIKAKDDLIKLKDEEIKVKDEEMKAKDDEIKAKDEQIKAKDEEIKVKNEEIQKLKGQVTALKQKEAEMKAKLAEEMLKLQTTVASAWVTFQHNVTAA
ncbi:Uncharacterized Bro-N domain-containing protein J [Linum perenne]